MSDNNADLMHRVSKIHFIGIGGAGMSGIAEVLCNQGYAISGSDTALGSTTTRLRSIGATVFEGHHESNVAGVDVVVYSSAVDRSNVELEAARKHRIPVVPRAEMLAELMRFRHGIAVAGTHGKTTTTSLTAAILAAAGLDPTFVVGGLVRSINAHAKLGNSKYIVVEADESDASFLMLQPLMVVLTNVDADHMDTYEGDFAVLSAGFTEFLRRLPFYGVACICIDDPHARALIPEIRARVVTFGMHPDADVRAVDVSVRDGREHFRVQTKVGDLDGEISLNMSGEHNIRNALGAIAVALELGVEASAVQMALAEFEGIARRCQVYEHVELGTNSITVVDDYGHHPTELAAVLKTIRRRWPGKRLVSIFQPHRFTRTRDLFDDFARVLSEVDVLLLLDVYGAGEEPIAGADSRALARAIRAHGKVEPIYVEDAENARTTLERVSENDDIVAVLGAGNVSRVAEELVA